jgi:predicted lysophospholipase L1 biosynthesis ABC-type transport system permease subunit
MGLRFAELIPRNDGLGFDAGVLVVAVLVSVTVGRRTTGWDPADPEAEWQTIVGVFSVVSYSVGRRVREVAVRMALGGTPRRVVALVMRQGLVPVATGLVLGAATALVFLRVLTNRLFGIAAHDPLTFTGAAFLVFGIAALVAWLPARRASRVEPMTVLRSE